MREFAANRREEKPEFQDIQDLRDFTKVPESAVSNSRPERRRGDAVVGAPLRCTRACGIWKDFVLPSPCTCSPARLARQGTVPGYFQSRLPWGAFMEVARVLLAYLRETMLDFRFDSRL
jgi:hypothetical protein